MARVIPWFRLQSDVDEHDKTLPLSDAAFRVWICALAFSKRTTSRGFIPTKQAIRYAAATDGVTEMSRVTQAVTDEVTRAGLWSEVDGGFLLTNWKKHQTDPAERTQEQRDRDRDRKRKQRENENVTLSSPLSESLSVEASSTTKAPSRARLDDLLDDLEAIWPDGRALDRQRPMRDSALFEVHRAGEMPDDPAESARLYVEAHGFADGNFGGCLHLHNWIAQRAWNDPLPVKPGRPRPSAVDTTPLTDDEMREYESIMAGGEAS